MKFLVQYYRRAALFCKLQRNLAPAGRTVATWLPSRLNKFALVCEVEVEL